MSEPVLLHDPREEDDSLDEFATNGHEPAVSTSTVLDALKAQRARVAAEHTIDVLVPGWGGLLALRLGPITSQQQAKIGERAQKTTVHADAALLISAFRAVLGRARPTDEFTVLPDEEGDPLGLDKRLADRLDLGPVSSAREVVDALFARANAPSIAISGATGEWFEWARSASEEIDEDFLGE
jgi:hypothetical protein